MSASRNSVRSRSASGGVGVDPEHAARRPGRARGAGPARSPSGSRCRRSGSGARRHTSVAPDPAAHRAQRALSPLESQAWLELARRASSVDARRRSTRAEPLGERLEARRRRRPAAPRSPRRGGSSPPRRGAATCSRALWPRRTTSSSRPWARSRVSVAESAVAASVRSTAAAQGVADRLGLACRRARSPVRSPPPALRSAAGPSAAVTRLLRRPDVARLSSADRRRARLPPTKRPDGPRRPALRRPGPGAGDRPARARPAADEQPPPRPLGLPRRDARRAAELTVQATGIGGPSAAIVIGELAELGLAPSDPDRNLRGDRARSRRLGATLVVDAALAADGTSRALGASRRRAAARPRPDRGAAGRRPGSRRRRRSRSARPARRRRRPRPGAEPRPPATCRPRRCSPLAGRHGVAAAAALVVGSARRPPARGRAARGGAASSSPTRPSRRRASTRTSLAQTRG